MSLAQEFYKNVNPRLRTFSWRPVLTHKLSLIFYALILFLVTIFNVGKITQLTLDFLYLNKPGMLEAAGATPNYDYFEGSLLQKKAFRSKHILPIYGSSEMSYMIDYHPSDLFSGKPTGFAPFVVGRGGMQTLVHVLNISALGEDSKGKKLAVFLTPQWYGPGGIPQSTFAGNFSPLHTYEMLFNPKLSPNLKRRISKRLLQFPKALEGYPILHELLKEQAEVKDKEIKWSTSKYYLPARLDFAALQIRDMGKSIYHLNKITKKELLRQNTATSLQPWYELEQIAINQAKTSTTSNPFKMADAFYKKHIEPDLKERKDTDKEARLFPSPEYEDLNLLMDSLTELGARPLFVVLPMNGLWYDYTGFPKTERDQCYTRLATMVKESNFKLADFSSNEYTEYFLRDPWHLAWKGWLDVDKELDSFYHNN